jgi:hypothetical protein
LALAACIGIGLPTPIVQANTVDGQFAGDGPVPSGVTTNLTVVGRGGIPAVGVQSVAMNVTVTNPTAESFVTVWPTGQPRPATSNLNFLPGETVPNMVVVDVGEAGQVSIFSLAGTSDVIVDVLGWFPPGGGYADSGGFTGFTPARLMDTRAGFATVDGEYAGGGALGPQSTTNLSFINRVGVPIGPAANAVVLNVTVTNPTQPSFLTLWQAGFPRPSTSNLNFVPGQTVANMVVVPFTAAVVRPPVELQGKISIFNLSGTTDVVVDVLGEFNDPSFNARQPFRLMDTRVGGSAVGSGQSIDLSVVGLPVTPVEGVGAVALNVTVTNPTARSFLTVWPTGQPRPTASNLNFVPGQTVANMVMVPVGSAGRISIFNLAGTTDVIVDLFGWFSTEGHWFSQEGSFVAMTPTRLMDTRPETAQTRTPSPLQFNFGGAVGLALTPESVATQSNLLAVGSEGSRRDAVSSGTARVKAFQIGPNHKTYITFAWRTDLADTAQPGLCVLAEVDEATGRPVCIEDDLDKIRVDTNGSPWIQFDAAGAIYYLGRTGYHTVLRRYYYGATTDLMNEYFNVRGFSVLPDGTVVVSGNTVMTGATWIRRISAAGAKDVAGGTSSTFLNQFSDGNLYIGWGGAGAGVKRYLPAADSIETKFWMAGNWNPYDTSIEDAYFLVDPYCVTVADWGLDFCDRNGGVVSQFVRTSDGAEWAYTPDGVLMKYYPALFKPTTEVTTTRVMQQLGSDLFLAGLNASSRNVLTMYNTSNDTETELIGSSNSVEIYHLQYAASVNKILFDGLRIADAQYVFGQIDPTTLEVSATPSGSSKLIDFQTF